MKILRLLSICLCLIIYSCNNISFDSDKWKNWEENESNMHMRLDMANDLIKNHDLIGKSSSYIDNLLGKPDINYNNISQMRYNIGPCRGFGISYGVLTIKFKDDKVIEVYKNCH